MSANRGERLLAQAGGVSGLIYSSLPVAMFVIVSSAAGLMPAIGAALGTAAVVMVWRLVRRQSVQPAVSGFFGVAVCALIAYLVGQSKGYFLLGIWTSLLWAVVFGVSIVVRRPLVGYLWSWAGGRDNSWRQVPRAVYAFDLATLCWALVFAARFAVQGHLYELGRTGLLGAARIAMGWPLTGLAALVTYAAIKAVMRATGAGASAADHEAIGADDEAVLD
ncbi:MULTISPECIES: DUF3159 domain-containing protein [Mycobacterium]|uniref:Membrane protein n=1 Tax=Mycobacterium kiyosense TaxID=2871094 RepID=A0A9P3Q482_9MYCO|nr:MULTISPECIES: DUF3159 domain-containing protein [Mycobacterium]BDB43367.1 membrane protein [Mycobacterium kiyosense]BDE13468.1 membrane protein [Mycobacterium sp. 20KCMC460]GLB83196.1 membrane protein [Mycobacterium kiyosense]GLB88400.1 membrane protein [Mycobacterium kiyosense]GLB94674.1 membrane protein [Mycobacterium kiyosense]